MQVLMQGSPPPLSLPRAKRPSVNVHIYPSQLSNEMRMEKIARSIAELGVFARVELVGIREATQPDFEMREGFIVRRISRPQCAGPRILQKIVQTMGWSWRVFQDLRGEDIKCVNSHSLSVLPLGVCLKVWHGARLIYDTHELETEVSTAKGRTRWLYKALERLFIGWTDEVIVVSDSIADWYRRTYGIRRPMVVRNVPAVPVGGLPAADPALWRERFGIPANHLIFIYQGGLFQSRRIEQLIRVFARAKPDRHIVFMGYGELETAVRAAAAQYANIHFAPAVKPADVLRHTAGADVGLVGVENVCLSYYYSLPNKLLEFLLAGIPALMPGFPEMMRVTESSGCGWAVGESDADWLGAVNAITSEQAAAGKQAARSAGARLSWQHEAFVFGKLYRSQFVLGSV
jgi:glycosyltransferase involved in cell wall biosynthesis